MSPLQRLPPFTMFPALGDVINRIIDRLNSLTLRAGPNVKLTYTSVGTIVEAQPGGRKTVSGGMTFRGEWSPTVTDYSEQDVVVIRGGVSAGTYVALQDVPVGTEPAYPDVGIYWASLSRGVSGLWG